MRDDYTANGEADEFSSGKPVFPATRFQGSKLKIADWIWDSVKHLEFTTVLDAFGGTGCVGYTFKLNGKKVTYNDILKFNRHIGLALIENDHTRLDENDIDFILKRHPDTCYPTFVFDTFKDIYFTDDENAWIDMVTTNIGCMDNCYKQALTFFALFQSCIIKRPFNLFHRKNLYLRFNDVKRNFGNKASWDTPFEDHFRKFVREANRAVFSNGHENRALNSDVFDIDGRYDLVYIDTPYISRKGVGVDYLGFYHFLEGLAAYDEWPERIDYSSRHRTLKKTSSVWTDRNNIHAAFDRLFAKFEDSILVVSYRSDGIPGVEELERLLKKYKKNVVELKRKNYKYALSNTKSEEILLIGK